MPTFNIEVLKPKAKKLLMDLAELRLISVSENISNPFLHAVKRIRSRKVSLTQDEISKEVESVRSKRYGKST